MSFTIPGVLIPKTGTKTSSFYVLIAAWIVGGVFTGLFTLLVKKGYLTEEGAVGVRATFIQVIADGLPIAWLWVSGWLTKAYIQARGRIAEKKAEAMGQFVTGQPPASSTTQEININPQEKEG